MPDYPPGTPLWVDLGSPDVDASITFYGALFGWTASEPGPPESGGYRFFEQGGKMVAGLGPLMAEGQPPAWSSYVSVADADATAATARDAGGSVVVAPMDVMDVGRFAFVADPAGAMIGLWQPRRHTGAEVVNEPVSLTWNELNTRDVEASKPFYGEIFSWEADTSQMGDLEYTTWKLGGKPVGGMTAISKERPAEVPSHWLAYFAVADTDATVKAAQNANAQLRFGPADVPAGRFAVLADPHGAVFGVVRM